MSAHPTGGGVDVSPNPSPTPVTVNVEVHLNRATDGARIEFANAVEAYANCLASESERQELSLRPPGSSHPETTGNAVCLAKQAMSRFGERARPTALDRIALVGVPVGSGAAGAMASYLNSALQISAFGVIVFLALLCVGHLSRRRLL
jgi:hypothetical protein